MSDLTAGLNEAQKSAVEQINGPSLVIAGAGSGKTRVLTCRIANLLAQGVQSYNILSLTFTNKAASEMKDRITSMLGEEATKNLWMGTFHSVFSKILRFECEAIGFSSNFTIYDTTDAKNLVKKIIKDLNLDKDKYKVNEVLSHISKAKNNLITSTTYFNNPQYKNRDRMNGLPELANIYKIYVNRCRRADAMDFDDLLLYTNILFRDKKDILKKYQGKFKYILVDEYQDTNFAQYLIVKKIADQNRNLCVVGDDAQSIYSFRGAKIENILNFRNDYPDYKLFKLEQNYRSTQTIVEAANSVIKKNESQLQKKTFSQNEVGDKIRVNKSMTDIEEGYYVANCIQRGLQQGQDYKDFAILYRTNSQSRIFEEALNRLHVPCKIHGGISFFQRKEIKDLLCYFRLCINPKDEEAIERVINYPTRGIGTTSIEKLLLIAEKTEMNLWEILSNIEKADDIFKPNAINKIVSFRELIKSFREDADSIDAYSMTERILSVAGIMNELKSDKSHEGQGRMENVQELLNGIKEFTEDADDDENTLQFYLEKISLLTDLSEDKSESINKVSLMTIHSSKGLEFKHCFLVGLEENLFPSQMSMSSEKDIEEERRLFYVAVTRAEKTATVTYAASRRKWGKVQMCAPSRFILEIDNQFLELPYSPSCELESQAPSISSFKNKKSNTSNLDSFRKSPKSPVTGLRRRQMAIQQEERAKDFVADKPEALKAGMLVEHITFGSGTIVSIEGELPNAMAIIDFGEADQKKLLLKFAKLRILN